MRNSLLIEVTGKLLQVSLQAPVKTGNPLARLSSAFLGTQKSKRVDAIQIVGEVTGDSIRARLERALEALAKRNGASMHGADVRVQLGADFSRLAVIDDPRSTDRGLSKSAVETHIQTWMTWNWGVAGHGIVRHVPLAGGRLLVSVVAQDVFDSLQVFCKGKGLRLVDCRPGALAAFAEQPLQSPSSGLEVVVWTEVCDEHVSPLIQFVTRDKGTVLSVHRMWLPGASQEQLQGVAGRLRAHHAQLNPVAVQDSDAHVAIKFVQWPAAGGSNVHV